MSEFLRMVLLLDGSSRAVVLGAALLGVGCGVVGSLAVLRRRALLGDCLAHAALPGVCLAYVLVGGEGGRALPVLMAGAMVSGLLAVGFIAAVRAWTRVKEDAAVGIALASSFGLGLVLLSRITRHGEGNRAGLDRLLFGQAAAMVRQDVWVIGVASIGCCVVVALLLKEFRALCFDRAYASTQGWPVVVLDGVLMGLVCVCTVAGLPAAGVVLVAALLVIPAVTARLWTSRLGPMLALAGVLGGVAGAVGVALSATVPGASGTGHAGGAGSGGGTAGWPTGPMIVLTAGSAMLGSLVVAPGRGVVAAVARHLALRRMLERDRLHGPLDPGAAGRWAWLTGKRVTGGGGS